MGGHSVDTNRVIVIVGPRLIYEVNRLTIIDENQRFTAKIRQTVSWRVNLVTGNIFMCFGVVRRAPTWREATTLNLLADILLLCEGEEEALLGELCLRTTVCHQQPTETKVSENCSLRLRSETTNRKSTYIGDFRTFTITEYVVTTSFSLNTDQKMSES